jgi:hypothetical protein
MLRRRSLLPFVLLLLAGCLQDEGPAPTGSHLVTSQTVESPGFITVGGETMVRFNDRKSFATTIQGGVLDVWISSFDGKRQRKVVANWSDSWPEQGPDSAGVRYFMVDESRIASGAGTAPVASLVLLDSSLVEQTRIEGISTYSQFTVSPQVLHDQPQSGQTCPGAPSLQSNCPQLAYERPPAPGQIYPSLFLWDGVNNLLLGPDSGSFQFQTGGSGASYFILDTDLNFTRLNRPSNTLELLRKGVSRFAVSGDEHYAAIAVTDSSAQKTVVRDLTTGTEIPLARPNPSSWGGFGGNTFSYSQNATGTTPAELHTLDLVTGDDTTILLPSPLVNLAATIDRNNTDEWLLLDSQGHGVFAAKNDFVARRIVPATNMVAPSLTDDGNYLVYISPALPTLYDTTVRGALMVQDAALAQPARTLSPPGLQVPASGNGYFFTPGPSGQILVFWAHLGRANSDLFFANYQTGDVQQVAKEILSVTVSAHSIFGIVNASQQDGVGDFVLRDLDKGVDTLYAQSVAWDALLSGTDLSTSWTAYVVRGRASSDRSGLWLTTLAPPVSPDGGTD